jgi:hypothetical protein
MNNAILNLLVRTLVVYTHLAVRTLLRNRMDHIQANMIDGLICQSWTHSQWLDTRPKDQQFHRTQPTTETTGK